MIGTAFGDCLGGLLSVVVQNLEIKFNSLYKIKNIYTSFKVKDDTINVGDLYSEEEKNIIIEIDCDKSDLSEEDILKIKYKYIDLVNTNLISNKLDVKITRGKNTEELIINKDVLIQKFRIKAITLMNSMINMTNNSIEKSIYDFEKELKDNELLEDLHCKNILDNMKEYLSRNKVNTIDATHCIRSCVQELCLERSATTNVNKGNKVYSNSRKNKLAKVFSQNI